MDPKYITIKELLLYYGKELRFKQMTFVCLKDSAEVTSTICVVLQFNNV